MGWVVIDGGATAVSLVVSAEERVDAIAHMGRKIYLFSTLTVNYPEGIRLGISGRDIQAETLSGKSLSSPAPHRQSEPGSQSSPHGPRHGSG